MPTKQCFPLFLNRKFWLIDVCYISESDLYGTFVVWFVSGNVFTIVWKLTWKRIERKNCELEFASLFFCCGYISLNRGFSWLRNLNSKYSTTNDERYRLLLHFLFFFCCTNLGMTMIFILYFVKLVSQPKRFSSFSFQFHVPPSAFPFCFHSIVEKIVIYFNFLFFYRRKFAWWIFYKNV